MPPISPFVCRYSDHLCRRRFINPSLFLHFWIYFPRLRLACFIHERGQYGDSTGFVRVRPSGHAARDPDVLIITFLQYSLGIYILNGSGNWTEIFRLPLIYAAIAGLIFNLAQIKIPELLLQPIIMLGQTTVPTMLITLGYRLYQVESLQLGHALGGALLGIFGGFVAANIAVNLIGAEGVNRQVLLLYGSLPAAVVNFILTEKYRQDPGLAASIVVLSTFISVLTIPIVFWVIYSCAFVSRQS